MLLTLILKLYTRLRLRIIIHLIIFYLLIFYPPYQICTTTLSFYRQFAVQQISFKMVNFFIVGLMRFDIV